MANVLIFAYYSYKDPVFQSAVLPYFKSKNENRKYILLTWEQKAYQLNTEEIKSIKENLSSYNIIWYRTQWHSGKFKIFKKAIDFIWGCILSLFLLIKFRVGYIYSEGFPGAIISHYISLISGKKHIVHTFEPHADYMLEANVWSQNSWEYKFLKYQEKVVAKGAFKLITATQSFKDLNIKRGITAEKIIVLPSCVDSKHYKFDKKKRNEIRQELGTTDDVIVLSYLGKLGGMYMTDEIFEMFSRCFSKYPQKFHFMLFNDSDKDFIRESLIKYKIPTEKVVHQYLSKDKVPEYLSASDFGIVAVKPFPSKKYCSPIKNGEYLSCGLPLLTPANISDDPQSINMNEKLGLILPDNLEELPDIIIDFYKKYERLEIANVCRLYAIRTRDISLSFDIFKDIFK